MKIKFVIKNCYIYKKNVWELISEKLNNIQQQGNNFLSFLKVFLIYIFKYLYENYIAETKHCLFSLEFL